MKTWKILIPTGLAAAGAVAVLALRKRRGHNAATGSAPRPAAAPAKPAAAPKQEKTGSYSFISGFQDAATVELTLRYDADRFSFDVVEDNFLSYSSDSHVALMEGEDFSLQLEYAAFYGGEDLAAHRRALAEKYRDLKELRYGSHDALCYQDGDNLCLVFPIPDDAYSYVLVTLVKAKGNDDELADLLDYPDLHAILGSLRFSRLVK